MATADTMVDTPVDASTSAHQTLVKSNSPPSSRQPLRSLLLMRPSKHDVTPAQLDQGYTTANLISFFHTENAILQDACDHLTSEQAIQIQMQHRIKNICRWLYNTFSALKIHTAVSRTVLNPSFKPPLFFRFVEFISESGDQDLDYSRKQLVKLLDGAVEGRGAWGCEKGSRGETHAWEDFHQAINAAVRLYGYSHEEVGRFVARVKGLYAVVVERKDIRDLRLCVPEKRPIAVLRAARTMLTDSR